MVASMLLHVTMAAEGGIHSLHANILPQLTDMYMLEWHILACTLFQPHVSFAYYNPRLAWQSASVYASARCSACFLPYLPQAAQPSNELLLVL